MNDRSGRHVGVGFPEPRLVNVKLQHGQPLGLAGLAPHVALVHVQEPSQAFGPLHMASQPEGVLRQTCEQTTQRPRYPWCHLPGTELTTSDPSSNATRVRPPGSTQVSRPVTAKGLRSTWRGNTPSSRRVGHTDRLTTGWLMKLAGSAFSLGPGFCQFDLAGERADDDPVAASLAHRLDHQFPQVAQGVVEGLLLPANEGSYIWQNGIFAQVIADDPRHVGVDGIVVGHARADRVGQGHVATGVGAQQSGHSQHAVGPQVFRVQEIVVDAPVDHVHRLEAGGGLHEEAVLFNHEVPALDQGNAHFPGQEHVLGEG